MKTPRAYDKLDESRFFLGHLKEEDSKPWGHQQKAFQYYLSAFLSAANSVVYVVDHDIGKGVAKKHFREWKNTKRSQGDRELLNWRSDLRGSELHREGLETSTREKAVPAEMVPGFEVFGPPASLLGEGHTTWLKEQGLPPWSRGAVYVHEYYFPFGDKTRVIQTCEQVIVLLDDYLAFLQDL